MSTMWHSAYPPLCPLPLSTILLNLLAAHCIIHTPHQARDTWGFKGYITSDCGAVADVMRHHHYTTTPGATLNAVLAAGMDSDCGAVGPINFFEWHLASSMRSGVVSNKSWATATRNLLRICIPASDLHSDLHSTLHSTSYLRSCCILSYFLTASK